MKDNTIFDQRGQSVGCQCNTPSYKAECLDDIDKRKSYAMGGKIAQHDSWIYQDGTILLPAEIIHKLNIPQSIHILEFENGFFLFTEEQWLKYQESIVNHYHNP